MANPTYNPLKGTPNAGAYGDGSVLQFAFTLTTADHTGSGIPFPEWADVCASFYGGGTWGGATGAIEGSNDGSNWMPLNKADGATAASTPADKMMQIIERPMFIRPRLTTPGTAASVVVHLTLRRPTPMRT